MWCHPPWDPATEFFLDIRERDKVLPLKAGALSNIPAQSIPYKPIKFKIEFCGQTQIFLSIYISKKRGRWILVLSFSQLPYKDIPALLTVKEKALTSDSHACFKVGPAPAAHTNAHRCVEPCKAYPCHSRCWPEPQCLPEAGTKRADRVPDSPAGKHRCAYSALGQT